MPTGDVTAWPSFRRYCWGRERKRGPVTVTHAEMRRYFVTIPEQVRIMDLAKDLIRLSGLEEGVDVSIEFTGVRPGEKLYEELLFGGEDVRATHHPKVLRATSDPVEATLAERVDHLIRLAASGAGDAVALKDCIREIVPEFSVEDARTNRRLRPSPSLIDAVKQVRELS